MRAASSMSSQLLTGDLLVIICPMNFCLFSISCQLYESNVPSVTYRKIFTLSFMFPCLKIRPSCCSMSEGHTRRYMIKNTFLSANMPFLAYTPYEFVINFYFLYALPVHVLRFAYGNLFDEGI